MMIVEQLKALLRALPDPAFVLSRSGKYVAVFGGRDKRYYHDGSGLVGANILDLVVPDKARWFLQQIARALESRELLIEEYELSNKDVKGLTDDGPLKPIWFEGRIQALDFQVDGEEVVLWVASNISERYQLERKLRELSDTDQLTGLFNRRKLQHDLNQQYDSWVKYSIPTSVFIFDLDNLKKINDTQGHHAGDAIIQAAANICRAELRHSDTVCRFGGDEFVVSLPNTMLEQAQRIVEHLHRCLRTELRRISGEHIVVTASIGLTVMKQEDQSPEDAIRRADAALYTAKNMGKDRVVTA